MTTNTEFKCGIIFFLLLVAISILLYTTTPTENFIYNESAHKYVAKESQPTLSLEATSLATSHKNLSNYDKNQHLRPFSMLKQNNKKER